ncbi:FAD-dependent monooxygenase [Novosphingobium sp. PC22D]|uniref:FAD-dependent monooxygenase n=1 Tax=Novosphingobium sp. PC22D TaxID=1962403 RepID=UPI0014396748|nr:FAD-dependent monooxygenase [Novosphingobium sp. PC22D]
MENVIIAGGGIAGLSAALALLQKGVKVRLYEQAKEFAEVGAGITLSQPASRGLFSLGLQDVIEKAADIPARAGAVDFETGEPEEGPDLMQTAREAGEIPYYYQIHRADLHEILADAVRAADSECITLGKAVVDLAQDAEGVTVTFQDGSEARGDVLLGADGINSRVRALLFGEENPRFTGQVAYRFLVPVADVADYLGHGASVKYTGQGKTLLRYIIRHGTLVNGVGFVPTDSWTEEGWSTPVEHEELLEKFAGANPELEELLKRAPIDGTRKWALFDRDPIERWVVGRVALLGDGAHPMLPFLGLGAAMGIEDAVVLGRALTSGKPLEEALAIYEATRKDRANGVLLQSRAQGLADQSGGVATARPLDHQQLMAYDPASVPLAA